MLSNFHLKIIIYLSFIELTFHLFYPILTKYFNKKEKKNQFLLQLPWTTVNIIYNYTNYSAADKLGNKILERIRTAGANAAVVRSAGNDYKTTRFELEPWSISSIFLSNNNN